MYSFRYHNVFEACFINHFTLIPFLCKQFKISCHYLPCFSHGILGSLSWLVKIKKSIRGEEVGVIDNVLRCVLKKMLKDIRRGNSLTKKNGGSTW